ncbi:Bro-N domain-containing protein [Streptomyces sp. NPDC006733]|uniref:BRO-N domain-containing protein n=1 Tax=Streptomyces sp. NPDC006733 TaxID=3155460 RepID=UPI0033FAF07B
MSEHIKLPNPAAQAQQDAIDVNDFVYAATGSRVRRLTMPDGTHWFPAADVATNLGYANSRDALAKQVPREHVVSLDELARTVALSDGSRKFAAHGLRSHVKLVNLQGLIRLVNACTKPEAEPFKRWVAEVVVAIQRDGSYSLQAAEVQPAAPDAPTAYAMPGNVADAIVRLEQHNLRLDEALLVSQREAQETRRDMARSHERLASAMDRIGDTLDALLARQATPAAEPPRVTAETVLAEWKSRLSVTEDVWAVAVVIAPVLAEHGEIRQSLETIAARTGLSTHRVNECLRFMRKHACIRSLGGTPEGSPVYTLNRQ